MSLCCVSQLSPYAECHYTECQNAEYHNPECQYAECQNAEWHYAVRRSKPFMLSVVMMNVVMLSAKMLNAEMPSNIMLNVVMLNVMAPFARGELNSKRLNHLGFTMIIRSS